MLQPFGCDGDRLFFHFCIEKQVLELIFIELELLHACAKGRLVVAFGDGIDDVADLLIDVGKSCVEVANFRIDMFRLLADGNIDLFNEVRDDFGIEQFLLHLVEDVALDIFAPDFFVRAALFAVSLVAAVGDVFGFATATVADGADHLVRVASFL